MGGGSGGMRTGDPKKKLRRSLKEPKDLYALVANLGSPSSIIKELQLFIIIESRFKKVTYLANVWNKSWIELIPLNYWVEPIYSTN